MRDVSTIEKSNLMLKIQKTLNFYANTAHFRWRDFVWPLVKPQFDRPIFVVGCSRAGTTVVYNLLGMAPGLASMHKESHDFWNSLHPPSECNWESHMLTVNDIGERDREEVSRFYFRNLGEKRFIDKANQNCFRISFLHELFPNAVFVFVKRDARDNINSLIHGWSRPDEYAAWSKYIPVQVSVENGKYNHWCFFLFPGWRLYVKSSIEEVCAHQWISANQAILAAKQDIPSNQWVEIFYEDILSSAAETFREVYRKLDLPFSNAVRNHCETVVSYPYNAFSTPRLNKWKQENPLRIKNILSLIEPTMLEMGYKIKK